MNNKLSVKYDEIIKESSFYKKLHAYVSNENKYKKGYLLSGNWGSGKTFLCNYILNNNKIFNIKGCLISLFNSKNIDELRLAIYQQMNKKGLKVRKKLNFLKNIIIDISSIFFNSMLEEFKKINLNTNNPNFKNNKFHNFLICLDDFDRTKIPYHEIFGLINALIDSGCKVLLISNSFNSNNGNLISLGFYNENKDVLEKFKEKLFIEELKLDTIFFKNAIISINNNELNGKYRFIHENFLNDILYIITGSTEFAENLRIYYEFLNYFKEIVEDISNKKPIYDIDIQDIFFSYLKSHFKNKNEIHIPNHGNQTIFYDLLIEYFDECIKNKIKPDVMKIIDKLNYAKNNTELTDLYKFFNYFFWYKQKDILEKIQLFIKWLEKQKSKVGKNEEHILERILYSIIHFYSIIKMTESKDLNNIVNKLASILEINDKFKFRLYCINPYQFPINGNEWLNKDRSDKSKIYSSLVENATDLYFKKRKEKIIGLSKNNYDQPEKMIETIKKFEKEHKFIDIICKINDMEKFVKTLINYDSELIDDVRCSLHNYYQLYGVKEFIENVSDETINKLETLKELLWKEVDNEIDPVKKELLIWFYENINEIIENIMYAHT